MKNSKIGGRTPNASHNCSDEKQHHKELQVIQTEGEELFKHVRQVQVQPAQPRWKSKLKLSPKGKHEHPHEKETSRRYKISRREKDNKSEERKHDRSKRLKKTSNRRSTGRR